MSIRRASLIAALFLLPMAVCAFAQDEKPRGMRGAEPPAPRPPAVLIIGANDVVGGVVEPGWPIVVSATLVVDEGAEAAVPPELRLKMTDADTTQVALPFEAVPRPAEATAEDAFYWVVAEEATRALAPGRYNITIELPEAQRQLLRVASADLRVVLPDADRARSPGPLRIQRAMLSGKPEEALAEVESLIAADAKNTSAWVAKGDLLMAQNKPHEALAAYDVAMKLTRDAEEEPSIFLLERRRAAFMAAIEKGETGPATKPAE